MEPDKKTAKPRRRPSWRLWLLCLLVLALAALLALDWRLETHGLPDFAIERLKSRLAAKGIAFSASSVKVGFWRGARIDDVTIETGSKFECPYMTARRIRATLSPARLIKGNFMPFAFEVENGRLSIPVFPESGEEGVADCISISDFNGMVKFSHGRIYIDNASGLLQNFEFNLSGTIDNFLSAAGAKGSAVLHDKLSAPSSSPRQASDVSAEQSQATPSLSSMAFASKAPMQLRRRVMRTLDRLRSERFSSNPKCEIAFALDLADFRRSQVKAITSIPAFNYGHLRIGSMRQELSLKDGILALKNIRMELGRGEYIEASGTCDAFANTLSGEISGLCEASKLMLFLDEPTRRRLESKFKFGDELIAFKGSLQSLSLASGRYNGSVEFHIPNLFFNGIAFSKIAGSASIDGESISGEISSAAIDSDGEVEGSFLLAKDSFEAGIEGSANFETVKKFLSPATLRFVEENIRVKSEDKMVSFSGALHSDELRKSAFSGSFDLFATQMSYKDLDSKTFSAHLEFKGDTVRLSDIHATLDDGTKLSGELRCNPSTRIISASVSCLGSPERMIVLLGPEQRSFVKSIVKDIDWPLAGNLVESNIDLHYRYGSKPFCFLTGSLVMTDFEYRGMKFKYGATRFAIDSDRLLLLPAAILESKDGQAQISICYRASQNAQPPLQYAPEPSSGQASDPDAIAAPDGKLDYEISSTLSGNDLLRCFYPQWKSEYIDFPKSLQIAAKGFSNYRSPDKSAFSAKIQNGSCVWRGAQISNIDVALDYKGCILSFKGASADISSGKLSADYEFNFKDQAGDIVLKIQDAELQTVLRQIGWGEIIGNGKPGRLSGEISSKFSYAADGKLVMDGKGKMGIAGADLWSIPLFGEFLKFLGRAWSLDSLGSVTAVDCECKLVKDHFETDSIKSDGGFVALRGGGKYYWDTNDFDFKFRAELLKSALPFETMARLLTPVSWMLERRLHGRDLNYKWE